MTHLEPLTASRGPPSCRILRRRSLPAHPAQVLACQPPDCDRNDCGSCGNACCLVEFDIPSLSSAWRTAEHNRPPPSTRHPSSTPTSTPRATPASSAVETKDAMLKALSNGGPDSRYKLSETAEGSLGFADLRPYKKPVDFIGQAIHTTQAMHYNDTVNWTLAPTAQNGTVVTVRRAGHPGSALGGGSSPPIAANTAGALLTHRAPSFTTRPPPPRVIAYAPVCPLPTGVLH